MSTLLLVGLFTFTLLALAGLAGDVALDLLRVRPSEVLARLFGALAAGLLIIATGSALVWGKGWTSPLSVLILLLIGAVIARRPTVRDDRPIRLPLAGVAAAGAAYAAWLTWWVIDEQGRLMWPPLQQDNNHYVVLQTFLETMGIENPTPSRAAGMVNTPGPYHFVDLWLATGLRAVSGVAPQLAVSSMGHAAQATTFVLGVAACTRRMTNLARWAALAVGVGAVSLSLEPVLAQLGSFRLLDGLANFAMNTLINNKLLVAGCLVMAVVLVRGSRRNRLAWPWLLAALASAHVTFLPFCLGVLGFDVLASLRKRALKPLLSTFAASVAIVVFLVISLRAGAIEQTGRAPSFTPDGLWLKTAFNVVAGTGIRGLALLLVLSPVFFGIRSRALRTRLIFPLAGLVGGLGAWALLHRTVDSVQLLSNPSSVLMPLFIATGIAWWSRKYRAIAVAVCIAGLVHQTALFKSRLERLDSRYEAGLAEKLREQLGTRHELGVHFMRGEALTAVLEQALAVQTQEMSLPWLAKPYQIAIPIGTIAPLTGTPASQQQTALLSAAPFFKLTGRSPFETTTGLELEPFLNSQPALTYAIIDPGVILPDSLDQRLRPCVTDSRSKLRVCHWNLAGGLPEN